MAAHEYPPIVTIQATNRYSVLSPCTVGVICMKKSCPGESVQGTGEYRGAQLKLASYYNGEVIKCVALDKVMSCLFTCGQPEPPPLPVG